MTSYDKENAASNRRVILERIRCGEAVSSGPLAEGLRESDKIVVASFQNPYVCRRFRRALSAVGVESAMKRDGVKTSVELDCGDREKAFQVLAEQQEQYPDRPPYGIRRAFDFTILGTVLGATMGVVSFQFSQYFAVRVIVWAGFIGSGMIVGYFTDRFRRNGRYLGHVQFEIADCLLLTTAAAVLVIFWAFVFRLP